MGWDRRRPRLAVKTELGNRGGRRGRRNGTESKSPKPLDGVQTAKEPQAAGRHSMVGTGTARLPRPFLCVALRLRRSAASAVGSLVLFVTPR